MREGKLRILSCNCSGWKSTVELLSREDTDADVVCCQEHHRAPHLLQESRAKLSRLGWTTVMTAARCTDDGGYSGGVLIAVRNNIDLMEVPLQWAFSVL